MPLALDTVAGDPVRVAGVARVMAAIADDVSRQAAALRSLANSPSCWSGKAAARAQTRSATLPPKTRQSHRVVQRRGPGAVRLCARPRGCPPALPRRDRGRPTCRRRPAGGPAGAGGRRPCRCRGRRRSTSHLSARTAPDRPALSGRDRRRVVSARACRRGQRRRAHSSESCGRPGGKHDQSGVPAGNPQPVVVAPRHELGTELDVEPLANRTC